MPPRPDIVVETLAGLRLLTGYDPWWLAPTHGGWSGSWSPPRPGTRALPRAVGANTTTGRFLVEGESCATSWLAAVCGRRGARS